MVVEITDRLSDEFKSPFIIIVPMIMKFCFSKQQAAVYVHGLTSAEKKRNVAVRSMA